MVKFIGLRLKKAKGFLNLNLSLGKKDKHGNTPEAKATEDTEDDYRNPDTMDYRGDGIRGISNDDDQESGREEAAPVSASAADTVVKTLGFQNFNSFMDFVAFPEKHLLKNVFKKEEPIETNGEEHFLNNMGNVLQKQGKLDEALELYEKSLALKQKSVGGNHSTVADSYNNIANVLQEQGKLKEAIVIYKKSLAIKKNALGEEHMSVVHTYNNLANAYIKLDELYEASELYEKILTIKNAQLGEDNEALADTYIDIGILREAEDEKEEAIEAYENAYAIRRKKLGANSAPASEAYSHISKILEKYNDLASALDDAGKYDDAKELYEIILEVKKKNLGDSHPSVADTYVDVALLLENQDEDDMNSLLRIYGNSALHMYEKAIEIYKEAHGSEHPEVANTYIAMLDILRSLGRNKEANNLEKKANGILLSC
jgi:tetratricopeptide (TPR) repeat protein